MGTVKHKIGRDKTGLGRLVYSTISSRDKVLFSIYTYIPKGSRDILEIGVGSNLGAIHNLAISLN